MGRFLELIIKSWTIKRIGTISLRIQSYLKIKPKQLCLSELEVGIKTSFFKIAVRSTPIGAHITATGQEMIRKRIAHFIAYPPAECTERTAFTATPKPLTIDIAARNDIDRTAKSRRPENSG